MNFKEEIQIRLEKARAELQLGNDTRRYFEGATDAYATMLGLVVTFPQPKNIIDGLKTHLTTIENPIKLGEENAEKQSYFDDAFNLIMARLVAEMSYYLFSTNELTEWTLADDGFALKDLDKDSIREYLLKKATPFTKKGDSRQKEHE